MRNLQLKSLTLIILITCCLIAGNSFAAKKIDAAKEDLSDLKNVLISTLFL